MNKKKKKKFVYLSRWKEFIVYRFPIEYEENTDLLIDIIDQQLIVPDFYSQKTRRVDNHRYGMDLYRLITPLSILWPSREKYFRSQKFLLLGPDMVFNYFMKNWRDNRINYVTNLDGSKSEPNIMKKIVEDYNRLHDKAIIEINEEIIREII